MLAQLQVTVHSRDMWHRFVKMTGVLCGDGKQRVFRPTSESDTYWSTPGYVQVKGKKVSGFLTHSYKHNAWVFHAYTYRKNGNVLPDLEV